jgi:hypothetical protein
MVTHLHDLAGEAEQVWLGNTPDEIEKITGQCKHLYALSFAAFIDIVL